MYQKDLAITSVCVCVCTQLQGQFGCRTVRKADAPIKLVCGIVGIHTPHDDDDDVDCERTVACRGRCINVQYIIILPAFRVYV